MSASVTVSKVLSAAALLGAAAAIGGCTSDAPPVLHTPAGAQTAKVASASPAGPLAPVVTPTEPPRMAALARRLAAVIDGAKPQVTSFPLDLDALPQVTVHSPLDAKTAAKLDKSKLVEDPDVIVKPPDGYARSYMLTFGFKDMTKVTFGHIRVNGQYGANDGWFGEGFGSTMTTYMTCGGGGDLSPVYWETLRLDGDHVTYTMADGVLDRQSCRVLTVKKSTANAKPLLPQGILFGFRACVGSCSEREDLTLLFPRATASAAGALGGGAEHATGSFSAVSFPIQRGGGGAFVARILRHDVSAWRLPEVAKPPEKLAPGADDDAIRANAMFLSSFELGVEVSQATDDESPVALAYMDIEPAALPPAPTPKIIAPTPAPKAQTTPSVTVDPISLLRR